MPDLKLLKKAERLYALNLGALLGCFVIMGLAVVLEAIVGIPYDSSWIPGIFVALAIAAVDLVIWAVTYIKGIKLTGSAEYREQERALRESMDIYRGPGKGKRARALYDAAAGGHRRDKSGRVLVAAECLLLIIVFIPGYFTVKNSYDDARNTILDSCEEIADDLESTGVFYKATYGAYNDVYGYVHAYLDTEREAYMIIDIESDGSVSEITYCISTEGIAEDAEAMETANAAIETMYTALGETSVAETELYQLLVIDEDILFEASSSTYYREVSGNVEICCSYDDDDGGGEYARIYVWIELQD